MSTEQMAVADVAAAWGVQPGTVRAYAARGQMPTPDGRVGRSPWWHRATIQAWARPGPGTRRADVPTPEPALLGLPVVVWLHGTGIGDYGWATVATAITRSGAVVIRDRTSAWHLVRGGCTGWEVSLTARDRRMVPVRSRHGDIEDGGDGMDLVPTGSPVSLDVPSRRDPQVLDQMGRPGGVVVDWPEVAARVAMRLAARA